MGKKKVFTEKINILLSTSNTSKVLENMYIYFSLFVLTRKEKKSYRNFFFKFTRFLTENNTFFGTWIHTGKKKRFPSFKKKLNKSHTVPHTKKRSLWKKKLHSVPFTEITHFIFSLFSAGKVLIDSWTFTVLARLED